jgi:hypothetical protein
VCYHISTGLYQNHRIEKATKTFAQIQIKVCKLHVKEDVGFRNSTGESNTTENVLLCIMTEIRTFKAE